MSPLELLVRDEIRARGPMSFARFMELALYHPEWGYYARADAPRHVGRGGDFFTSVSVGPLFGKLLARQFARWWEAMDRPDPFHLIECGGLDGRLAGDILTALKADSPSCFDAAHYVLVEPLPRLMECQKKRLAEFSRMRWLESLNRTEGNLPHLGKGRSEVGSAAHTEVRPPNDVRGIIFANELLDAFPVHRLEKVSGQWMECCITLSDDVLTWTHQPCPPAWTKDLPPDVRGQVEYCPEAVKWLREATSVLRQGRILLLDYGWTDEEYFQVERPRGTVRAYQHHRLVEDVLARPGEQDLTCHVRWTPLLGEAGRLGFQNEEFIQQGRWLTRILAERPFDMTPPEIRQFQTLTHPEMMGTPFRVVVFRRE